MKSADAAALAALFTLLAYGAEAQTSFDANRINRAVISELSAQYKIKAKVVVYLDLTETFQTKSQWSLVIGKQPDEESSAHDGADISIGAVCLCFVKNGKPDCSEALLLAKYRGKKIDVVPGVPTFHELIASDLVFSGPGRTLPLLNIKVCESRGVNGNCGVSTFVLAYDGKADKFRVVFFNMTGRNNNEETRLVDRGPLLGSVIVATPTQNAPFTYFVEIYQRMPETEYSRVLKYRGHTGYGDGNRLAVIDSEMPEMLGRLGLWKEGDELPVPPRMPGGCTRLLMRKGVEWCKVR